MSIIPPNPLIVQIKSEPAPYIAALEELTQALPDLADSCPEFLLRLEGLLNEGALLATDGDCLPTTGTNPLIVRLEPSEGLVRLLTAIRAGERNAQLLNDCFRHSSVSVGCFDPSNEERASTESQGSVGVCPSNSQEG